MNNDIKFADNINAAIRNVVKTLRFYNDEYPDIVKHLSTIQLISLDSEITRSLRIIKGDEWDERRYKM